MSAWRAGFAEVEITPPLGVWMTGYAGRPGPADHVLDPLYVRALALSSDGPPLVLTGGDLLGIDDETVTAIREGAGSLVAPERLLLNHSHTHSGPATSCRLRIGKPDPAYRELLARWTVTAVAEALRNLRPARLRFGQAESAIGMNRRAARAGTIVLGENPAGAYEPAVSVLRVEETNGRPLACWFSHATHPTVMSGDNTGLSAEWPGAACATLSRALGCPALFAQGCCGDVNPVRRGSYEAARSIGRELAGAALIAWERAEPVEGAELAGALETVRLPQTRPSREEAVAALGAAEQRYRATEARVRDAADPAERERARRQLDGDTSMLAWARDYLAASEEAGEPSVPMDVQALRLGDVLIVATGAETFVEIGQEIVRRSPLPHTVALGYSNGCFGYLPTAKAFPLAGYEVETAYKYYDTLMITPDAERLTLEAAERVMRAVSS